MKTLLTGIAVLLFVILCTLPWGGPGGAGAAASIGISIPIAVIFACGFWWPYRLPSWIVFLAGLLGDAVTGGPLGYWALLYLLALAAARAGRDYIGAPRVLPAWATFAATASGLCLVAWAVTSLYRLEIVDWRHFAWQMLILSILFPGFGALLAIVNRWTDGGSSLDGAGSE